MSDGSKMIPNGRFELRNEEKRIYRLLYINIDYKKNIW